jgi:alkylation response protein AidB-like acyl-CoA dehydrogenase
MANYTAPLDDMRFLMQDVFELEALWQSLPGLEDANMATAEAILEEAAKISQEVLAPLNREADESGCRWEQGEVFAPAGFKHAYQTYCEGGWGGLGGSPDYGGMGMPKSLVACVEEMLQGAGLSFGLAPMLTAGACVALNSHASESIKQLYLPRMYCGEWAGAMDLTEPHCGTDLGLIRSKAEPNDDGSYSVSGTKIFITWGEHDMAENIVHLVLAKLPDAPAGSKGISLFLVPKFLVNDDGTLGERNGVSCGSLEKKMGIKGSATCVMNYDGAKGWLVGEPHQGLAAMFTMMNYERLGVGLQGVAVAEASYQTAAAYARERLQGRSPAGPQGPEKAADSLLVHPDVRRMLLNMRALNEGGRAFYLYVARWLDIAKYSDDAEGRAQAEGMVALLTPVAKAFLTDMAFDATVDGQQVLGGHGYIRESGQEQFVRDARITQIYEGTNGIQAMDLIGRKTLGSKGALVKAFMADVEQFLVQHQSQAAVSQFIQPSRDALASLAEVTDGILANAKKDASLPGAVAVDYLHLVGYVAYAYMWLRMAVAAENSAMSAGFCEAKRHTAQFFFAKLLPHVSALRAKIEAGSGPLMAMPDDFF